MSKDPAFLFYSQDFTIGTQFFTDEQVGKYIRLLCAQHQHGHLSEQQVNYICSTYDATIMKKFIRDDNGLFYNERLDSEVIKRKSFCNSRKENIKKRYDVQVNNICSTSVVHMENENENVNKGIKDEICIYDAKVLFDELINSQDWINWILTSMTARDNNINEKGLIKLITMFIEEQRINNKINRSLGELKRHFFNWFKLQVTK